MILCTGVLYYYHRFHALLCCNMSFYAAAFSGKRSRQRICRTSWAVIWLSAVWLLCGCFVQLHSWLRGGVAAVTFLVSLLLSVSRHAQPGHSGPHPSLSCVPEFLWSRLPGLFSELVHCVAHLCSFPA